MARVLLFGPLRDLAGWREREVEAATLFALRARLADDDAALGEALDARGVQAAVEREVVHGDVALFPATEVAFLPPMSGG